jgi:hypothetical protein
MKYLPRRIIIAALLLTAMQLTGCVYSNVPLTDAKTSTPDARLLGNWEVFDKDKPDEKHTISLSIKKGEPNVIEIATEEDGKAKTFDLFLTKIGNDCLGSVLSEEKDKKTYIIGKYELTKDDVFKYWALDTDYFTEAVKNKEVKGTLKKGENFTDVILEDSPEHLRKFIEKHGDKCFSKETTLTVKRLDKK